jgi:hypothetical protein
MRTAAKRDDNEPEIRERFAHHGWHTEALSDAGMPDLLCWPPEDKRGWALGLTTSALVDVKERLGKPTKPQVKKWTALHTLGVPVYIARSEADVDAIVAGTAEAWAPPDLSSGTCPACVLDPQSPCKHDGEEKGVAAGTQPPRRKNRRPVDEAVVRREAVGVRTRLGPPVRREWNP